MSVTAINSVQVSVPSTRSRIGHEIPESYSLVCKLPGCGVHDTIGQWSSGPLVDQMECVWAIHVYPSQWLLGVIGSLQSGIRNPDGWMVWTR